MSQSRNNLPEKNRKEKLNPDSSKRPEEDTIHPEGTNKVAYSVTVSKKNSDSDGRENACSGQKSFISIHSTDLPCQMQQESTSKLIDCNVEVLSIREGFPSTSEESLDEDDESSRKTNNKKFSQTPMQKLYCPGTSKSVTNSERVRREPDSQVAGCSDFDITKNTLCVTGSNPGEPKMCYNDPPKKISKTMRKFLRNIDKLANESRSGDREEARAHMTRGILKEHGSPECTGDALREEDFAVDEESMFTLDWSPPIYSKHGSNNPYKNVSFNTQVVIIHLKGDLCVGQSVETLSKERDQQARNSELRKTFISKYNEFWPQK